MDGFQSCRNLLSEAVYPTCRTTLIYAFLSLQSFTWGIYNRQRFLFVFWNFLLITRYFEVRVELQTL